MSFTFGSSRTKSAANVSEKGRQHETWKKTRKSPFKQLGSFPSAEHRPFSRAPIAQIAYMAVGMPRDAGETNRKRRPRCSKQNLSEFMGFIYGVYLWNLWGISMYIYVYLVGPISLGFGNGNKFCSMLKKKPAKTDDLLMTLLTGNGLIPSRYDCISHCRNMREPIKLRGTHWNT